jgi:monofunctional biosynthetic peptidoglycan transglycosylase
LNFEFLKKIKPRKTVHWVLYGLLLLFVAIALVALNVFLGLPNQDDIKNYYIPSTVESFENFNWEKIPEGPIRKWVPLSAISENLQEAVIISEDDTFFQHHGVNLEMIKKAFEVNLKRKHYARGASTITMQLARNAFLTKEKSLIRKLKEIIVAHRIEGALSKNRILELYLNLVEWGENIYGAEAAAQYYFGKSASELNLAESTLLASILPNPKRYNPFQRMQTVKKFQKRVLDLMKLSRIIDEQTVAATYSTPIYLRSQTTQIDTSQQTVEIESRPNLPQDSMGSTTMELPESIRDSTKSHFDSVSIYDNFRDQIIADSLSSNPF